MARKRMRLKKLFILVATVSVVGTAVLIYLEHYSAGRFLKGSSELTQKFEEEETEESEHGYPDSVAEIREFIGGAWKVTYSRIRPGAVGHLQVGTNNEIEYSPGRVGINLDLNSKEDNNERVQERVVRERAYDGRLQPVDDPETVLVKDPRVAGKKSEAGQLRQQLAQSRGRLDALQFRNMSSQLSALKTLQKLREQAVVKQQGYAGAMKLGEPTQTMNALNQHVEQNKNAADIQAAESPEEHSQDGAKWNPPDPEPQPHGQRDITEADRDTDEYDTKNDKAENQPINLVQPKQTAVGRNPSGLVQHQVNDMERKTAPEHPSQQISTNPKQPPNLPNHKGNFNFSIKPYFSMPLPQFTQDTILKSEWVQSLKEYLSTLSSKQISIVTATQEHEVVLLNWLISALVVANPPLENVLVLSLSKNLAALLRSKGIPVILLEPSTVIRDTARTLIRSTFSQVHIVRLSFFRLINHWGFDVVMYDGDAITLKNPQPLFNSYPGVELIGSAGKGPDSVFTHWGRTICTGVLLMRASYQMGEHCSISKRISVGSLYSC